MKKIFILLVLFIAVTTTSYAQVKVGVRLAPAIGLTGVYDKSSTNLAVYARGGNSMAFSVGPTVDVFLNDNIAFNTGLYWTIRQISINQEYPLLTTTYSSGLQYLQVPLTFKAYTNEMSNGMKIYGQLGGILDFKISDKLKSSSPDLKQVYGYTYEKWYQYVNVGLLTSAGVEYTLGNSSAVYAGLFYQRGFINQARNFKNSIGGDRNNFAQQARVALSSIGLEVGFKF